MFKKVFRQSPGQPTLTAWPFTLPDPVAGPLVELAQLPPGLADAVEGGALVEDVVGLPAAHGVHRTVPQQVEPGVAGVEAAGLRLQPVALDLPAGAFELREDLPQRLAVQLGVDGLAEPGELVGLQVEAAAADAQAVRADL